MSLQHQVAIITGGGSGMGAATARALHKQGAKIVVLDKNKTAAEQTANDCDGIGFECDVSNASQVETIFQNILKQVGKPYICVNCAGIAPAKRIVGREGAMPLTDFANVIQVNLIGTFNVMRLAAHCMSDNKPIGDDQERGVIINTSSVAAYEGQVGQAAYSASKAGIVGLTLPAARELAKFHIRVVTIAPGLIATPLLLNMPQEVQDSLANQVPFPKRFGKPEEFARLVQYIITNPMINGEVIRLDGAMRMGEK